LGGGEENKNSGGAFCFLTLKVDVINRAVVVALYDHGLCSREENQRHTHRHTLRHTQRHTLRNTHTHGDAHTERRAHTQRDTHTHGDAHTQRDTHTHTHTQRETHTHGSAFTTCRLVFQDDNQEREISILKKFNVFGNRRLE